MNWRKAPAELVETFHASLPDDGRVEPRKMFGYPCAFVSGNMFTGLHGDRMIVRLPEQGRDELLRMPGAAPFVPMPGRPMREYVVVPPDMPLDKRRAWVKRSLEWAATLPPKQPKEKARA
jgi:TfoX/Sxy family transcriptional regulator of competence genes